ncbi:cholesterol transport system auxiliary component [Oxalobacteraceae bacterium GrIS 1.11]
MNQTLNRSLTILTLAGALAGCAGKGPLPTLYDFGPLPAAAASGAAAPNGTPALAALAIADASGPSWLDSQRMYYRLLYADAQQSRPYAQNHWNTAPLQLFSQRLRSRIAQSGTKVLAPTDAALGVLLLRVEVEDFSQNFDTPTSSSGQVTARASAFRSHRLIDQKTFSRSAPAVSADAPGGAKALAAASDTLAADIIAWLATLPPQKE